MTQSRTTPVASRGGTWIVTACPIWIPKLPLSQIFTRSIWNWVHSWVVTMPR